MAARRKHKARRVIGAVVVLAVLAAAFPPAMAWAGSAGRVVEAPSVGARDVTIVFGAGLASGGSPSAYLAARLDVAAALYHAGKTKVLLVSGSNPEVSYNEPKAMQAYLVAHGVPSDKIVLDYAGADTYGTCVRAKRIFGVDSAILVSQGYHLPRAVTTCRLVGVDAVGVGDETVRTAFVELWWTYSLREIPAYYKMVLDVASGRQPVLGQPDGSIAAALER